MHILYACLCALVYICVNMYICAYMCGYTDMYVCIYTYIHIIHTQAQAPSARGRELCYGTCACHDGCSEKAVKLRKCVVKCVVN
jgi:hypothetical protein